MDYLTAYYWQQEPVPCTALFLQHRICLGGRTPVILACIAQAEESLREGEKPAAYVNEQVLSWMEEELEKPAIWKEWQDDSLSERLECRMKRIEEELKTPVTFAGLLCVEERFLLFGRGMQGIFRCNSRWGKACCQQWKLPKREESACSCLMGSLEPGVVILLATDSFWKLHQGAPLQECLTPWELTDERIVQKRLQELGREAVYLGAEHAGALLLVPVAVGNRRYA